MREYQPVRHWRMRIEPKSDKGRRIWIRQIQVAQNLKRMRGNFLGVRNQLMDDFQSVNIGGMFLHAAVAADDRRRNKQQRLQKQEQHDERSPIFLSINLPVPGPPIPPPFQPSQKKVERQQ